MKYRYDGFGRVIEVQSPYDDTAGTPYAKYEYHTPSASFWYTVRFPGLLRTKCSRLGMCNAVMDGGGPD